MLRASIVNSLPALPNLYAFAMFILSVVAWHHHNIIYLSSLDAQTLAYKELL